MKIFNKIKKLIQKNQANLSDNQFFTNKTDIIKWLDKCHIKNYIINDDLSVDVDGAVDISRRKLKVIPVKFGKVSGGFWCNDNQLTNLIGSPETVGRSFWCSGNKLTSLIGSPKTVGGLFNCCYNKLLNLIGSPKMVGDIFNCDNNQLISLVGAPETVGGDFYCNNNKLMSLFEVIICNFKKRIYFSVDEKNFEQKELIQILKKYYRKKYYTNKYHHYILTYSELHDIIKPQIDKEFLQDKTNKLYVYRKTKKTFI